MIGRQKPWITRLTSPILRGLFRVSGGFHVCGLEHIPEHGPAIVASNHLSWADPPALRSVIRRRCWFMGNDFLFRIPVLGRLLPFYGGFPVERGKIDREAIRRAEAYLRQGDLLVIFPEGGTTITGTLYPFEGGTALLALRNDVPIVPAAVTGTDHLLPMTPPIYPRFTPGGISLTFGPPLHPRDLSPDIPRRERVTALTDRLYEAIAAMLPDRYLPAEFLQRRAASGANPDGGPRR